MDEPCALHLEKSGNRTQQSLEINVLLGFSELAFFGALGFGHMRAGCQAASNFGFAGLTFVEDFAATIVYFAAVITH
jgi:hypothetical protein